MKPKEREYLILSVADRFDQHDLRQEVHWLNSILAAYETPEKVSAAMELLNLNHGGFIRRRSAMLHALRKRKLGGFEFLLGKN